MGNKDGNQKHTANEKAKFPDWIMNPKDPEQLVDVVGNSEARILAKAFEEFSRNGITVEGRKVIERIDDMFNEADIVISKSGDKATIVQEDGRTFSVKSKGRTTR